MSGALLIALCSALWATDAIFRLPLARSVDSMTIVLVEHTVCVLATLPLFFMRRHETKSLKLGGWASLAFVGVMGSAVGTFLFTASFRHINPSVTILLQKIQPVFAVVAARLILNERPPRRFYGWAAVALLASTMVSLPELWSLDEVLHFFPSMRAGNANRDIGVLMAVGAAFVWAMSTVFGKAVTAKVSFPVTAFLRFVWGWIGILLIALARAGDAGLPLGSQLGFVVSDPRALRSVLYIALIPGVTAMYLYYAGLKSTKASSATFAEMFFPVAAVIINWEVLGQALTRTQIAGGVILLGAVFFMNRPAQTRSSAKAAVTA